MEVWLRGGWIKSQNTYLVHNDCVCEPTSITVVPEDSFDGVEYSRLLGDEENVPEKQEAVTGAVEPDPPEPSSGALPG